MITINLLPARRIRALQRRRRTRAWSLFGVAYVLALVALWSAYAAGARTSAGLAEEISTAKSLLASDEKELAALRTALDAARLRIESARVVADHPDWSDLLELLARQRGNDVALERVALSERPAPVAKGAVSLDHGPWVLNITGVASSHSAASLFVLRLEQIGIFESVSLSETRERGLSGDSSPARIDFTVVCSIPSRVPLPATAAAPEGRP